MCCNHLNRREFLGVTGGLVLGAGLASTAAAQGASPEWPADLWDPDRPFQPVAKTLRVQPILMYRLPTRREMSSWKSWGGIQDEPAVAAEVERITKELAALRDRAGFPMEVLPVAKATSPEEAAALHADSADATIVYPATGSGQMLEACIPDKGGLIFVRHKSGPVYYWYEALSVRYLRSDRDPGTPEDPRRLTVHDVVVDDADELLWRLRALFAARNFTGTRIVALGGPMGKYAGDAPQVARDRYGFDIVDVSYDDFGKRIQGAVADPACLARAEKWTDRYLALPETKLSTDRKFVVNAFVLYGLFKDLMREHDTSLFTIKECMGTVLPLSQTTACLTLALLNDEGPVAFCESDFVVIPPGVLLHHVTRKPVFMHNSTFPHNGLVTCAHCTGPRRMDGARYAPTELVTHYESEFGAGPCNARKSRGRCAGTSSCA